MVRESRLTLMVALQCEGKPWVDAHKMKKVNDRPFALYQTNRIDLVVTGVGGVAMATAIGWIAAYESCHRIWLNLGTAGHLSRDVGDLVRVHGCAHSLTARAHYPPSVARWQGATDALLSVDLPGEYPEGALVDMEGAAFFAAATRFSSSELVQSLKVVSDNLEHSIEDLNAARMTELMQPHVSSVESYAESLLALWQPQTDCTAFDIDEVTSASHSQRRQVADLVHKLQVLGRSEDVGRLWRSRPTKINALIAELRRLLDDTVPVIERSANG